MTDDARDENPPTMTTTMTRTSQMDTLRQNAPIRAARNLAVLTAAGMSGDEPIELAGMLTPRQRAAVARDTARLNETETPEIGQ